MLSLIVGVLTSTSSSLESYARLICIVVLLAAVVLSACERSASTPPAAPVTQADSFPVPEGTQAPMAALEQISTQTAIAASGGIAVQPTAAATVESQGAVVAAVEFAALVVAVAVAAAAVVTSVVTAVTALVVAVAVAAADAELRVE